VVLTTWNPFHVLDTSLQVTDSVSRLYIGGRHILFGQDFEMYEHSVSVVGIISGTVGGRPIVGMTVLSMSENLFRLVVHVL